jgi:ribosome-interacting GTPase 1
MMKVVGKQDQVSLDLRDQPKKRLSIPRRSKPKLKKRLAGGIGLEIVRRYKDGESSTKLATYFRIGKSSVLQILHENNVEIRHQPLTPEEIIAAIQLYQEGLSLTDVGARFDRSASAIQNALERAGVARRASYINLNDKLVKQDIIQDVSKS